MLGEGKTIPEAAKELGISEQTYHRWRNQYGGMKADDAERLKEFERENQRLKAIVADQVFLRQNVRRLRNMGFNVYVDEIPVAPPQVSSLPPRPARRGRRPSVPTQSPAPVVP
jgi:transposase-like protein